MAPFAHAETPPAEALAEVDFLHSALGVPIYSLPRIAGSHTFTAQDSFTADRLAGAAIDADPPELGTVPAYPAWAQDGVVSPEYVVPDLANFGFQYFHNTYNFGGWHTWSSTDYASAHGFRSLTSYARDTAAVTWMPAGARWLSWAEYVDWGSFMGELGLTPGRWDQVADLGEPAVIQAILDAHAFENVDPVAIDELMIDMEHTVLDPDTLRTQSWYPSAATQAERTAFEKKYYDGYALTYYAPVEAARSLGFTHISLYGWSPTNAGWFDLGTHPGDPAVDWYWQNVGLQVIPHVDSVNNSVYCYYWSAKNVAYTLAQNDLTLRYVHTLPPGERKPVRPYFWNQLHGGGDGWRWWRDQGLPNEDVRAMALLNAFTQYDGMVLWNWSGMGNPNLVPPVVAGADLMIGGGGFTAASDSGGSRMFSRYDAIHVTSVYGSGTVRFQLIDKMTGPTAAYYTSTVAQLTPHLRVPMESLAPVFEGLAMAKLLEWNLRHGTPVVDFDSQQVFASAAPVLRHIRNGDLHLIATYDPQVAQGLPARTLILSNFGGVAGLDLTFVADSAVRVYVIRLD